MTDPGLVARLKIWIILLEALLSIVPLYLCPTWENLLTSLSRRAFDQIDLTVQGERVLHLQSRVGLPSWIPVMSLCHFPRAQRSELPVPKSRSGTTHGPPDDSNIADYVTGDFKRRETKWRNYGDLWIGNLKVCFARFLWQYRCREKERGVTSWDSVP